MKALISTIILVALILIAAFTNPNEDAHFDNMLKEVGKEVNTNDGGQIIGMALLNLAKPLFENFVQYNNYVVFSTISFEDEHKEIKTISIGFFGQTIWLPNNKRVENFMANWEYLKNDFNEFWKYLKDKMGNTTEPVSLNNLDLKQNNSK